MNPRCLSDGELMREVEDNFAEIHPAIVELLRRFDLRCRSIDYHPYGAEMIPERDPARVR